MVNPDNTPNLLYHVHLTSPVTNRVSFGNHLQSVITLTFLFLSRSYYTGRPTSLHLVLSVTLLVQTPLLLSPHFYLKLNRQ